MRIPKFSLVASVAVAAICTASPAIAADSETQAKAREALRLRMLEMGHEPAPAALTEAPKPARPPTPAAPASRPVATTPTPSAPAPVVAAPRASATTADGAAVEKARAALRQRMQEMEGSGASVPHAAQAATEPATQTGSAPAADPAKVEKARQALHQRMSRLPAEEPARVSGKTQAAPSHGLQAPPSPLSQDKQDRLAELLRRYRADEIAPEEYHRERAKIIGEK